MNAPLSAEPELSAAEALVRCRISALIAEYGLLIDEERLPEWLELFTEDCDYKVITRENVRLGLPNAIIWCDNRRMLRDRVQSYLKVNEYNLHWDRHVIGPARITEADGGWRAECSYTVAQTTRQGRSSLFSVGRYEFLIVVRDGALRIARLRVVPDTGLIPTLLASPL